MARQPYWPLAKLDTTADSGARASRRKQERGGAVGFEPTSSEMMSRRTTSVLRPRLVGDHMPQLLWHTRNIAGAKGAGKLNLAAHRSVRLSALIFFIVRWDSRRMTAGRPLSF
jgi:hypothetical protein